MRVLRLGDRGEDVTRWQQFLVGQGYDVGAVDGEFGPKTLAATRFFQIHMKLGADGVVGEKTLGKALVLGFSVLRDEDTSEKSKNWPPCTLKPISPEKRVEVFGRFEYVAAPTSANPEGIKIVDGWDTRNIVMVDLPLVARVGYGPKNGKVPFHKLAAKQLIALWAAWEREGLIHLVKTWGGSWVPRFVRGSRTTLSNHCVPPSTTIWTPDGPAAIGDLKGYCGDVWSFESGRAVRGRVTRFFENGTKPLLRVRATGHELTCTPDHPVLVLRKRSLPPSQWVQHRDGRGQQRAVYWTEMVEAGRLRVGDRLVAVKSLPNDIHEETPEHLDWAEVLGLFLGDGCIHHLHGKPEYVSFCFPEGDRVRDHVRALLTRYFGEPPRESKRAFYYYKERFWSRFLPYDKPAAMKSLPAEVWTWSTAAQVRLALGLLYSDGTIVRSASSSGGGHSARFSFRFASPVLADGTRMLLQSLGFRTSRMHTEPPKVSTIEGVETRSNGSYHFTGVDVFGVIRPDADAMYSERVSGASPPFSGRSRSMGYELVEPHFTHHKISSIDAAGSGQVVDIEVDHHHNFIANGVVVSNCYGTAFDINMQWNGLGVVPALVDTPGSVRKLVKTANEYGFFWGGHFKSPDGMHFEVAHLV